MESKKQHNVYFREEQRFSDSPKKLIFPIVFLLSVGPLGYGMYQQLVLDKPWGDDPSSDMGLTLTFIFVFVLMGSIWFLFSQVKLEVYIDKEGIHYRFPIFIRKEELIKKEQIARYEVRKYSPFLEYHGWGYRVARAKRKRGIAYNISGNIGLQLYFTDGKKLLIGTQRPEAIKRAMKRLMEENDQAEN